MHKIDHKFESYDIQAMNAQDLDILLRYLCRSPHSGFISSKVTHFEPQNSRPTFIQLRKKHGSKLSPKSYLEHLKN